jgi:hypothetical protein
MDGYDRFYCGEVYQRVPNAYAEWCEEQFGSERYDGIDTCCRTGEYIAEAIEDMELHR